MTDYAIAVLGALAGAAIIVFALMSLGDDMKKANEADKIWEGARVTKICRDGTYIFHLKDGRYVTGGLGSRTIEDPATVCQS